MKKYILTRPVNALRKGYDPAFLGAKIRARKPSEFQAAIVEKSVQKKLHSSEDWNYRRFYAFKGIGENGERQYRECLAPSPSTSAAEAFLINELVEIEQLFTTQNVYSYRLSRKGASTNFRYFLPEYESRNTAILAGLSKSTGLVAVFFDIEKFYPSVDKRRMEISLLNFHATAKKSKDITVFIDFARNQLDKSPAGIPIGTELSHVLANIFLSELDQKLADRFGDKYFRYVDDITILCTVGEVSSVRAEVDKYIRDLGLRPNIEKEEIFTYSEWAMETATAPVKGEDFFNYCKMLESWLKVEPTRLDSIRRSLRDEGFHIPIEKIVARNSFRDELKGDDLSIKEIISKTKKLRDEYKHAAAAISGVSRQNHTRGSLQKARRAINPLFYLLDRSEYRVISEVAEGHPKLSVQREVSNAVIKNNCSSIIDYPGSTVSSFCEIWKTVQWDSKEKPILDFTRSLQSYQFDSLLALSLHNVVKAPELLGNDPLIRALRDHVDRRTLSLSGFENELESLRLHLNPSEQELLLGRRESDDEEIDMQALELGDQMISS